MSGYSDIDAWLERPRDYQSLVRNYERMHNRSAPESLLREIQKAIWWQEDHPPSKADA